MNFSSWAIRKPVPSILLFVLLTVTGVIGFFMLDIQDFPDMDVPTVQISATLEGAAPSQLETEVARKIEDRLSSITLLDHITTSITDGNVSITVSFELDKDSEEALSEVRNAVDSARADLPSAMPSPTVSKVTSAGSTLLTYTVASGSMDESDLSWFVDNKVTKALLSVKGVASVKRIGGLDREVHVDLDPALMAGMGVTLSDVSQKLGAMQSERSGGQGAVGGMRQSARTMALAGSVSDIAAISIPLTGGRYVRLDQIARIVDGHAERSSLAYRDGRPVIGVQVTRARGYSDVGVVRDVRVAMVEFAKSNPEATIEEANNTITPVEENYEGSMHLLIEGAVLAVLVVWWFLRDWRSTFIAAVALPLSVLPTFLMMALAGYSLNTVTLLSLSLVVGILVDDAIVEIENIERHLRMGKTPYQAAMEAADEIGLAVVATTLTLVAVFLPTAFMSGIAGLVFRQFGITTSVAVLASLLVARLLTPMMAAYLLKPAASSDEKPDGTIMRRYMTWVSAALRFRKTTIAAAICFFAVSIAVVPMLPTGFIPADDSAQTRVTLTLPPGSTLESTRDAALRAEQILNGIPEVKSVFAAVGTATSGGGHAVSAVSDLSGATLTVDLVHRNDRDMKQSVVEAKMREALRQLAGVRVAVGSAISGETLDITIAGDDPQSLEDAARRFEAELRTLKGIGNVTSSAALQRPEIQVRPDAAKAAFYGVTSASLSDAVRLATYGDYSTALPKLNLPERQIPIRVRMESGIRNSLDDVGQLRVAGTAGPVSLASVADVFMGSGPSQISRLDRSRNITLSVELNGRTTGEVEREAMRLPTATNLPAGVHHVRQGELQQMSELFTSFALAMAIGIFCIYAVLVLLFHDFLQPATILCALPLALGGALLALWLTHQSFSMPAVIGILMLMGIVTKNSILLVEYAVLARRDHALSRWDAVVDACHKRARPIVMTTLAMGAGMLPNALGFGAEPSFRQPMAIVVIGGLMTSTVLSLIVIPVVFTYVDDLLQWLRSLIRRGGGHPGHVTESNSATTHN